MSRKGFLIFSLFIILVGSGSEGETNFGIRHNWADSQGSGSASESLHCPAHLGQEDVELEAGLVAHTQEAKVDFGHRQSQVRPGARGKHVQGLGKRAALSAASLCLPRQMT